jgi:hypothetical protein
MSSFCGTFQMSPTSLGTTAQSNKRELSAWTESAQMQSTQTQSLVQVTLSYAWLECMFPEKRKMTH